MKIPKISALGYLSGGFLIASAFIRYWVLYSDLSQGIGFIISGFIIVFLAWLYGMIKEGMDNQEQTDIRLLALEEWIQDNWTESSTKAKREVKYDK